MKDLDLDTIWNSFKICETFGDCKKCAYIKYKGTDECIWERNNDLKNAIKSLREENEELKERIREYALEKGCEGKSDSR